jgi:hypothetical protein
MKRNSYLPLTICTVLGSAMAVTACHAAGPGAAGLSPSPAATAAASHAATGSPAKPAPASPSASPKASPPGSQQASPPERTQASPPVGPTPAALTRVVANCSVAPGTLTVRPKGILIACADGNLGVERMSWDRWGASSATGRGTLYENQCKPNCAEGKFASYPVAVTLSKVKASSQGEWFSLLTVTWEGARPANATPDSFPLMAPRAA